MDASAVEIHMNQREQAGLVQTRAGNRARAARLLEAWLSGDRQRLITELNDAANLGGGCEGGENDDGRDELLHCVARRMITEPDLYASRAEKLHLGVWLDLLAHLSAGDKA